MARDNPVRSCLLHLVIEHRELDSQTAGRASGKRVAASKQMRTAEGDRWAPCSPAGLQALREACSRYVLSAG